jgi:hypothetical protein
VYLLSLRHTTHLFSSSTILFDTLPSVTSTITLYGDVHGNDFHTRYGNGQHPVVTPFLAKNQINNFFVKIVLIMIFIKTTTGRGNDGRIGGEQVCTLYHAIY